MNQWRICCCLLTFALTASSAWAQSTTSRAKLGEDLARRYGLTRMWRAQIELDGARGYIEHMTQHVSTSSGEAVFEVKYEAQTFTFAASDKDQAGNLLGVQGASIIADDKRRQLAEAGVIPMVRFVAASEGSAAYDVRVKAGRFSYNSRQLNAFGDPLEQQGAKTAAAAKLKELNAAGLKAEVSPIVVADITLYVVTSHGVLQVIDGETGRTRWIASIGKSGYPNYAPAANDKFVAVVNGSYLYVLNADDGTSLARRRLGGAPGAGPAMSEKLIHVPLISGELESYSLKDLTERPRIYKSNGRAMVQPTVSPESVAWSTDIGWLYVGDADKSHVRFRVETSGNIVAKSTFGEPDQLFAASLDGYVYSINAKNGDINWRFSAGEPIGHPPIVVGESLFVITDDDSLYRISSQVGDADKEGLWWAPNVRRVLAVSNNRIYCVGRHGRTYILNSANGARIGELPTERLDFGFVNVQTDRIFVGSKSGSIQCFRQTELEFPIVHSGPGVELSASSEEESPEDEGGAKPAAEKTKDDPFGGDDPFGNDAGGDDASDDDPFGGDDDDDPFGGN